MASATIGEPPALTALRHNSVKRLNHFLTAGTKHAIWFIQIIPFLLMGRLLYSRKFQGRALLEAVLVSPWWLMLCSIFWPILAIKHADSQPKTTMRFLWLRLLYVFHRRKLLLTIAEKDALLASAGTAEENLQLIFTGVEQAALLATGNAKKLAFASFISALFSFGSLNIQPAFAQNADSTIVVEQKSASTIKVDGFAITTASSSQSDGQSVVVDNVRTAVGYRQDNLSVSAEVDVMPSSHLKKMFIGWDMPELGLKFYGGKIITPFAWTLIPPKLDPFIRFPLADLAVPLFDNGLMISANRGNFTGQLALVNGNGGVQNDNQDMDFAASVNLRVKNFSLGAVMQNGRQPDGERQFNCLYVEMKNDRLTAKTAIIERVDLKTVGFVAAAVFQRAGPVALAIQYDAVIKGSHEQYCDLGVNCRVNKECAVQGHIVLSNESGPEYFLRFKIILGN